VRIIAGAIRNPVAIGVTVLLISLFGALSLKQLPLQLQQAQVRHRVAQHDLDQTEVRVPCPGVITERLARRGEYVRAADVRGSDGRMNSQ